MSQSPRPVAEVLADVWRLGGLADEALSSVTLTGREPVLPSSFAVGTAAQVSVAASALAAAELWRLRSGRRQAVAVDMRAAAIAFRGEHYLRVGEGPAIEFRDPITRLFQCGDGRWVRIHANFPHHRDGVLKLLACEHSAAAVTRALADWEALRFEEAAAQDGLVATALRSFDEWDAHPQGRAVAALPLLSIDRIGDAPAAPLPRAPRPLAGLRVLDLTRVIAGPVCGRTLAGHGAEVLLVTGPHLPSIEPLVIETGRGKRSCQIDLRTDQGRAVFRSLLTQADIVIQGYRPGGLASVGFSHEDAARIRPGIIYVSLSAYGHTGPWSDRRGFDSLVQTASGFNDAEAQAAGSATPRPLPAQALDHATGYLMAFAAMIALARRSREGGSWHARLSLAQTGRWLRGLGRVANGLQAPDPSPDAVRDLTEQCDSLFGRLTLVRHPARLSATPVQWDRPPVPLGHDPCGWP
jgi:crotonobetainyl-CoA:carnitine CoA-transferase CaiB-like acyl-CoA transferase